jgi:hypothetical protein
MVLPSGAGKKNNGAVFQLAPSRGGGWTETVIYSFPEFHQRRDRHPITSLIIDGAGNLFGLIFTCV